MKNLLLILCVFFLTPAIAFSADIGSLTLTFRDHVLYAIPLVAIALIGAAWITVGKKWLLAMIMRT